jgi:hypothetical protein
VCSSDLKGDLCKYLVRVARGYVKDGIRKHLKLDVHMHDVKTVGEMWTESAQKLSEAVLTDFINYVAFDQGLDLALYSKDLTAKKCDYADK